MQPIPPSVRWHRRGVDDILAPMAAVPILRVARPSDDLEALLRFYQQGLGLELLYRFEDHAGFDGIILGGEGAPYHFEFTRAHRHSVGRAPTQDHLIVLYLPDAAEWAVAVQRMRDAGFDPVSSFNPYWDREGVTFEDPDGYRLVLQHAAWTSVSGSR
jgi:catechol 2,3-dioxygenase-like lactoylglutathione lyase family enzyme